MNNIAIPICTIIEIISTIVVGRILYIRIKEQNKIIQLYKEYANEVNPDKIIKLKDDMFNTAQQKSQLTEDQLRDNIKILQTQCLQLALWVENDFTVSERTAKSIGEPELFIRESIINRHMPQCAKILKTIQDFNQKRQEQSNV